MTGENPYCVRCLAPMECELNGVEVPRGNDRTLSGDLYRCKTCGAIVIANFGNIGYVGKKAVAEAHLTLEKLSVASVLLDHKDHKP